MQPNAMTTGHQHDDEAARRKGVRRTALIVAAIALAIYAAFLLGGVFVW